MTSPSRPGPRRRRTTTGRAGLPIQGRRRLAYVFVVLIVCFTLVAWRLIDLQAVGNKSVDQLGQLSSQTFPLIGQRGSILAANGDELAFSEMRHMVSVDPKEVPKGDIPQVAARLSLLLGQPMNKLETVLAEKTSYVVLATDISQSLASKIEGMTKQLPGVTAAYSAPVRIYPDQGLAQPLLGGVNGASEGDAGLEYQYNKVLSGTPGSVTQEIDTNGNPIPGETHEKPAVNGDDIITTLNETLQEQTENALSAALKKAQGKNATALVMNTKTGALLAVANLSDDNGKIEQSPTASAFTNIYEPGSVSKIITVSGALAKHKITPKQKFWINETAGSSPYSGPGLYYGDRWFHDAEDHPLEQLSPTGILAQSSNIGAIKVAETLGDQGMYNYLKAFGMTTTSAVDFPGESEGQVPSPSNFNATTLPSLAFGQGYATTAIQMIGAMNTVANHGVYVPPRLVTATVNSQGKETDLSYPKSHRVVPTWATSEMYPMLEQVVASGTGTAAGIPGYDVAGKTGTANAYDPAGGYYADRYVSTFAGFLPNAQNSVTVMVVVNNTALFGAQASAPAFRTIMLDAIQDLGIPSNGSQPASDAAAQPIINGQVINAVTGLPFYTRPNG